MRRLRDREANIDNISIHAPHEGVRHSLMCLVERLYRFHSTHPTRGCDRNLRCSVSAQIFQSTHPTRGCDTGSCFDSSAVLFQSTHPTRGCDFNTFAPRLHNQFQSTHPTRGCDVLLQLFGGSNVFQSTHPTRGCDGAVIGHEVHHIISIHAPHEGVRLCINWPPH